MMICGQAFGILFDDASTLGSKIKETPYLRNLIGQDQNVDPTKVTLGFGSMAWNIKVALTGPTSSVNSRKYLA